VAGLASPERASPPGDPVDAQQHIDPVPSRGDSQMSPIQPIAAFVSRLLRITCADAARLTAMPKAETTNGISKSSFSDVFI
jgi:hypothetical protein